ncbi:MAG: radical SAM protein [Dehalococcoidia bacterium]|jgi:MoaA/NifB/PqqE/SkfB family radical SAM enzyme|nr:radical SAM protein [Dehalococcoidia bacterium]
MAHMSLLQGIELARGGIHNYITKHPIVVSYEVTLSCNCNCHHCDLGGVIKDEKQITPEEYRDLTQRLKPLAAQISGGEPLLRRDIAAIVRAIKQAGVQYAILVTNGVLLNETNYLQLREAGVSQFSVSLDFPDERHDEFRRRPGLYKRLERTLPQLAKLGFRDIILNTAITKANLREVLHLAEKAIEWGVDISYSAYTPLRTGNGDYCLNTGEDLEILRQAIDELMILRKENAHLVNPDLTLRDTVRFFEQGFVPDCKAGERFLVVMPDGSLVPCSLHRTKYATRNEMMKNFSRTNRCGKCYVAIRSYSEMSFFSHVKNFRGYLRDMIFH